VDVGALPSGSEWESIVQCCSKVGAWLFSDEMYRETEDNPSLCLTPACEKYERAISLSGLSKVFPKTQFFVFGLLCFVIC
jgi:aspartate/methionine/tyrosine aminotransferase